MDVGDDDLFAVFDDDSAKDKKVVIPDTEDEDIKHMKDDVDSSNIVQEICGSRVKRAADVDEEDAPDQKKLKSDPQTTLMTGLTDAEVQKKMEEDEKQARGDNDDEDKTENIEEDETVVSLVEAAPR